ncbi:helix-turn-helix domain-containing protein [Microbacterium sp. NPDC058389]|uniref:helix-turn-helix domain-containing protein n=1 Tax=Microbacterium sp. NPDC058389 TaxID=3346475 RepID=UPI0036612F9E
MTGPHALPARAADTDGAPSTIIRRQFDRLHLARVQSHGRPFGSTLDLDEQQWPFVVAHSMSGSATVGDIRLGESEFVVLTAGRYRVSIESGADIVILRIPAETVGPHGAVIAEAAGRPFIAAEGTPSLVAHLIAGLAVQTRDYSTENPGRLAQHVVGLLALTCADIVRSRDVSAPGVLQQAKVYIEAHLPEIDLTPDRIASVLNVSTRTLHRVFEAQDQTISGWIRARRLEQCRVELTDTSQAGRPVSAIGARWGLWDAAHFSRLFKSTYGQSPRAYRAQALAARSRTTVQLTGVAR